MSKSFRGLNCASCLMYAVAFVVVVLYVGKSWWMRLTRSKVDWSVVVRPLLVLCLWIVCGWSVIEVSESEASAVRSCTVFIVFVFFLVPSFLICAWEGSVVVVEVEEVGAVGVGAVSGALFVRALISLVESCWGLREGGKWRRGAFECC